MITIIGPHEPKNPDAINTTSRSATWSRGLSPFFLGPITAYDGLISKTMENVWQNSKVYPVHLDSSGNILQNNLKKAPLL